MTDSGANTGAAGCPLCETHGGEIVFACDDYRVVLVEEPGYPGYCRVIWQRHVPEMTDLSADRRQQVMQAVWTVEQALRDVMAPDKVNLASLGNMTPHVHWHVIPRFIDDAHFPESVWGGRRREIAPETLAARARLLPHLRQVLQERLA